MVRGTLSIPFATNEQPWAAPRLLFLPLSGTFNLWMSRCGRDTSGDGVAV